MGMLVDYAYKRTGDTRVWFGLVAIGVACERRAPPGPPAAPARPGAAGRAGLGRRVERPSTTSTSWYNPNPRP